MELSQNSFEKIIDSRPQNREELAKLLAESKDIAIELFPTLKTKVIEKEAEAKKYFDFGDTLANSARLGSRFFSKAYSMPVSKFTGAAWLLDMIMQMLSTVLLSASSEIVDKTGAGFIELGTKIRGAVADELKPQGQPAD